MALRLAVVVSQAPGLGGTPSAGHRSTAVANASAAASSAMSRSPNRLAREATTRAHSSRWARVIASSTLTAVHRNGRTSTFRLQAFDPSVASLSATSRSAASMIQNPTRYSFDSRKGPSVNNASSPRLSMTVAALGDAEAAGEDPVALRYEPVVEHVDSRHLVRGGGVGRVVDHRNQVLHLGSSPVVLGALVGGRSPLLRTLLPRSDTASRITFEDFLDQTDRERACLVFPAAGQGWMFSRSSSRPGCFGSQPSACRVRELDEGWSVAKIGPRGP